MQYSHYGERPTTPPLVRSELAIPDEGHELPGHFHDFHRKYADPEHKVLIDEKIDEETTLNYEHVTACGLIGEGETARMIVVRSVVEYPDTQMPHRAFIYDPTTGIEDQFLAHEPVREAVPYHGYLPPVGSRILEATNVINTDDTRQIIFSGTINWWVENGAYYPIKRLRPQSQPAEYQS